MNRAFLSHLSYVFQAKEELKPVKDDFEAKNKQLLDEMPKFYQSRIDYFQPSFEALIRAQVSEVLLKKKKKADPKRLPQLQTHPSSSVLLTGLMKGVFKSGSLSPTLQS